MAKICLLFLATSLVVATPLRAQAVSREGWDANRKAIVITTKLPAAETFRRTAAAFAAEGVTLDNASADAGFLLASPELIHTLSGDVTLQYRASVVASDSGSTVLLTGTLSLHDNSSRGSRYALTPMKTEQWARLERIADRIRGASQSRTDSAR